MALATPFQTVATIAATSTVATVYTVPSTGYNRDLVITNSGAVPLFVCLSAAGAVTAAAGVNVPSGGSVLLTETQAPQGLVVGAANTFSTAGQVSVGYGSVVSII